MQPKFTLKKSGTIHRLTLTLFVLFGLITGRANAQCTQTWFNSTNYPVNALDQATTVAGANLYTFAGVVGGAIANNAYKFDGTTWTPILNYPVQVEYPGACSDGTNCYIMGGAITGTGAPQTSLYRYNVASNTYTALASFTTAVWNPAAVYLNGKIYKIGGTGAASVANMEIYDVAGNTWSAGAPLPAPTSFISAWTQTIGANSYIFVAGGYNTGTATESLKTYQYDPGTNTWNDAAIADLPATRWGAAYGFYSGGGILAGGYSGGVIVSSALLWDPIANAWNALPAMPGVRSRFTGGTLAGSFYAIGGRLDATFNGTNSNFRIFCVPTCAGTPAPGNTTSTSNPICPGVNFTLGVTNTVASVTYQWQSAPSLAGPFVDIAGATASTYTTNIATQTAYQVKVTCTVSGLTGTSNPILETISPVSSCYCTPTYANGCTLGDYISNVTLGTLNNTSACSTPPYIYYSAVPAPTLIAGGSQTLSISVGPDTFGQYGAAWADWNQNGNFNDPGEFLGQTGNMGANGTGTITFTVPAGATIGTTRLRVRAGDDGGPPTAGQSCGATAYTFGESEDYNINVQPCVVITITGQPASTSVTCGNNTSFSMAATGSNPVYSWEYRVNAASPWLVVTNTPPFSGATTNTLTLTGVTQAYNGYQFRGLVSGACTAVDFTNIATLTVTAIVPTVTPSSATICLGTVQQLTLTNTLGNVNLINEGFNVAPPAGWSQQNLSNSPAQGWQQGAAATFPSHSGAANSYIYCNYLSTSGVTGTETISNWLFMPSSTIKNGDVISFWTRKVSPDAFPDRLELRFNTTGSTNAGATPASVGDFTNLAVSVNPTLITGVYPIVWTQYSYTVSGVPAPTTGRFAFRYFVTNGGPNGANSDYIGVDDVVYTSSGGAAQGTWNGPAGTIWNNAAANSAYLGNPQTTVFVKPLVGGLNNYTVSFTTPAPCTSATLTIPINVSTPVTGVTNPVDKTACVGTSATFTASASGGAPLTYQWQISTDGGLTYTDIAGATSTSYTQGGITLAMNNNRYRLVISSVPCGSSTTTAAILHVNALPSVVITSPDLSITPGQTTTINGTSTPAAATWSWTLNGSVVPAPPQAPYNTPSIPVGIDALGTYQATVTDINGCTNTSNTLTIGAEASEHLWIYPNPNNGTFQIRLFFDGNSAERRIIRIYNSGGQLVAQKEFDMVTGSPSYQRMDFVLPRLAAGPYVAKVTSRFSGRIISGVFIIAQ